MLLSAHLSDILHVAIRAALLYLTAVFAFRLSKRRALAEMAPFDFVAAIAAGAIVGRIPSATDTPYILGAITLITVLVLHRIITALRHYSTISKMVDSSPRVLFARGRIYDSELKVCGLTRGDLFGQLRQHGVSDISEVQFVVFEERGQISVIKQSPPHPENPSLICDVIEKCGKNAA